MKEEWKILFLFKTYLLNFKKRCEKKERRRRKEEVMWVKDEYLIYLVKWFLSFDLFVMVSEVWHHGLSSKKWLLKRRKKCFSTTPSYSLLQASYCCWCNSASKANVAIQFTPIPRLLLLLLLLWWNKEQAILRYHTSKHLEKNN